MKKIFIGIIRLYQHIPGSFHYQCRHIPSCSNYGIEAIEKHGCLKGSYLMIKRVLRCNPFTKAGYDPVPERKIR